MNTTATFDGHGRLKSKHIPQQDANAVTTYNYNLDNSISSVTDARGAVTNFAYNSRGLLTGKSWTVPSGSNITDPADVSFSYDNLGNRTAMTDGLGTQTYEYNSLSQMTAETRTFNESISNAPSSGNFRLEYTYALTGELKSLKDPYGQQTNYAYDKAGRLSSVTDNGSFAGISTYASSPGYRAWGGLKNLTYGNGDVQTTTYDAGLRPLVHELHKSDNTSLMSKAYGYYNDGSLKTLTDSRDARFDRLNIYDFVGRTKEAKTGAEARGEYVNDLDRQYYIPYKQNFDFDGLGNMTSRSNAEWTWFPVLQTYTYSNTRITNGGFTYDADGRSTAVNYPDDGGTATYDAAGKLQERITYGQSKTTSYYNGDGTEEKRTAQRWKESDSTWINDGVRASTYFIKSTVLGGQTVTEVNPSRTKTYVHAAGAVVATQVRAATNSLYFGHTDASGMSKTYTKPDGTSTQYISRNSEFAPYELAPDGSNVGNDSPPESEPDIPEFIAHTHREDMTVINGRLQPCEVQLDGFTDTCSTAHFLARAGGLGINVFDRTGHHHFLAIEEMLGQLFLPTLTIKGRITNYPLEHMTTFTPTELVMGFVLWDIQQQTQQKEHSLGNDDIGLRRTNKKATFSSAKFKSCLSAFGITGNSRSAIIDSEPYDTDDGLIFSGAMGNWRGSFVGTRTSDRRTVTVNVDGYSQSSLGKDGQAMGITPSTYSGNVAINRDISNYMAALATAIHEIGNGLGRIMHDPDIPGPPQASDPLLRERDGDPGQYLEECVFGGYVGDDGYVYKAYRNKKRR